MLRAAHQAHVEQETFRRFWNQLYELCLEGRFENIFPGHVEPDRADFTVRA